MTCDNKERQWIVHEKPAANEKVLLPIDNKGRERIWDFVVETTQKNINHFMVKKDSNGEIGIYRKWRINDEGLLPQTLWDKSLYSAAEYGTNLLTKLFGVTHAFMFPKSVYAVMDCIKVSGLRNDQNGLVLDYFAGSGTTGHAVINLNREDLGNRKYVLTEMGEYFETVTKPRIQKVVYSADWKNGKPEVTNTPLLESEYKSNGSSHIFQYIKLEQYEDTLNNITFESAHEKSVSEFEFADRIKYLLHHSTSGSPSLLAIDKFNRPFDYEMDIVRLNERVPSKIDLVTTFNFLLGIDVLRYRTAEHQSRTYHIIEGVKKRQVYLIVWRDFNNELDLEQERDFIKQGEWFDQDALIYSNADNAFGAYSIEAEFKRLMFEDVTLD
jgi:adenine-specific DNA-methyltransferase